MINTVIFDLDGLLIQSEICYFEAFSKLLDEYHYPFTIEEYASNYSGGTAVRNVTTLIEKYNLPITLDYGVDYIHAIIDDYNAKGIPLHKGARELLDYLKSHHYTICIGTSSRKEKVEQILSFHHIEEYFQYFAYGPEVKHSKPEPDIFLLAAKRANKNPQECLVLEDSENGILAASKANMKVICVPDIKKPSEDIERKATRVYHSLLEVINYLEEENHE